MQLRERSENERMRMMVRQAEVKRGVDNEQEDNSLQEDKDVHSKRYPIQKHHRERQASQYADHIKTANLAIHNVNHQKKNAWSLEIASCVNMKNAVEMLACKTPLGMDIKKKKNAAYHVTINQIDSTSEPFDEYILMTFSETTSNPWFWDVSQGHPTRVKNEDICNGEFKMTATQA